MVTSLYASARLGVAVNVLRVIAFLIRVKSIVPTHNFSAFVIITILIILRALLRILREFEVLAVNIGSATPAIACILIPVL